jgi:hypothetical protein
MRMNRLSVFKFGFIVIGMSLFLTACPVTDKQSDRIPPTVTWISPEVNASVSSSVRLEVTASDTGSGMAKVEFFAADTLIATVNATDDSTIGVNWDTTTQANGAITLKAVAIDKSNNRTEATRSVTVANTGPADTGEALNHITEQVMAMGTAFLQGRGGFTALNLPPGLFDTGVLLPLSSPVLGNRLTLLSEHGLEAGKLPRGTWQWVPDEYWGEWTQVSSEPLNGVIMQWTAEDPDSGASYAAELTVRWNGTQEVSGYWGDTVEVPTSAAFSLKVDGDTLAEVTITAAYYADTQCSTGIYEPVSMALVGWIGDDSGKVTFDVSYAVTASQMTTAGLVTLSAGSDAFSVNWNVVIDGSLSRGTDCFTEDFVATGGSIAFGASSTEDGTTTSFAFSVGFSSIVYGEYGELISVNLTDGSLMLNGVTVVTFSGTLDESLENVTLTFANGRTMTLKAFLETLDAWDGDMGLTMMRTALTMFGK